MSEDAWRRKRYYNPRVLISVQDTLSPPFQGSIFCLSGSELVLLRNLVQYLHRRSTFVSQYDDHYYLAPSNEEWDELEAIVAGLEDTLMADCTDIATQLACICDAISGLQASAGTQGLPAAEGQADYDDYTSPVVEDVGDPPVAFATWDDWRTSKCKSAQKYIDDLVAACNTISQVSTAGTVVTFAILNTVLIASTIAPPLALVIIIVEALAALGTDLMGTAVGAWLVEHKANLVCRIYNADDVATARQELQAYIDEEWDVVAGPQAVEYLLGRRAISRIYDGTMPDYDDWQAGYSDSYCDACLEPIVGTDWWAMPLDQEQHTIVMNHTAGSYWLGGCDTITLEPGTSCGVVFRVQNKTGTCQLTRISQGDAPCPYGGFWPSASDNLGNTTYFAVNGDNIDEVECKAAVAPGSTTLGSIWRVGGGVDKSAAFRLGYNCTGYAEVVITHVVYEGTP